MDNWKAIRPKQDGPWELYDLTTDVSETTNVADEHPEVLARMQKFAEQSHEPVQPGTAAGHDATSHGRLGAVASNVARRRSTSV